MTTPQIPPITGAEWMRYIEKRIGGLERRNPGGGGTTVLSPPPTPDPPRFKAAKSAAETLVLPHNTFTTVALSTEEYDSHAGHTAGASRYTVPVAGIYAVHGSCYFGTSPSASLKSVMIWRNSNSLPLSRTDITSTAADQQLLCYDEVPCAVGDYLELVVYQRQSTGTASITVGGNSRGNGIGMTVRWVSPL